MQSKSSSVSVGTTSVTMEAIVKNIRTASIFYLLVAKPMNVSLPSKCVYFEMGHQTVHHLQYQYPATMAPSNTWIVFANLLPSKHLQQHSFPPPPTTTYLPLFQFPAQQLSSFWFSICGAPKLSTCFGAGALGVCVGTALRKQLPKAAVANRRLTRVHASHGSWDSKKNAKIFL